MNLADIEAFLAITSTKSLTKAAEVLHLSQSSISNRLKNLEQEIGLLLIERRQGQKTITLTPAGEDFILVAEKWLYLWHETQSLKSSPTLSLSIGAVDSVNTYLLPDIYQEIIQQYPGMRLQIYTKSSNELYSLIEQRVIDTAFVVQEKLIKNVNISPLFTESMVVIRLAVPEHQAVKEVHPHQLNPKGELYHDWFPAYELWHNKWWDPVKPPQIQVNIGPMVLPLLRTPQQWSIIPFSIAASAAATGKYTLQTLVDPPPERTCYKLTHKFIKSSAKTALTIFDKFAAALNADRFTTIEQHPLR
jgi:DNA-binding transcriptional LysR family regulator